MRRTSFALLAALPLLAGCMTAPPPSASTQPARVIFFTEDSALLDDAAKTIVADAATEARARPAAPVRVASFTDPDGGRRFNQALAEARAEVVRSGLIEGGVAASRITVQPRGPVPFEMMPLESRRVEITVGN